jgi:transcriptional regulator with XRE-family HTH domain
MATPTPTKTEIDFTALVREIRQARHITQEQLARELQVTFSTVNGWENGKHRPIPALARRLVELADASEVPPKRYSSILLRGLRRARRRGLR